MQFKTLIRLLCVSPTHLLHLVYSAMIRDSHLQTHIWKLFNKLLAVSFPKLFNRWGCGVSSYSSFPHPPDSPCYFYVFIRTSILQKGFKKRKRKQAKDAHSRAAKPSYWEDWLTKLKSKLLHYNLRVPWKKKYCSLFFILKNTFWSNWHKDCSSAHCCKCALGKNIISTRKTLICSRSQMQTDTRNSSVGTNGGKKRDHLNLIQTYIQRDQFLWFMV